MFGTGQLHKMIFNRSQEMICLLNRRQETEEKGIIGNATKWPILSTDVTLDHVHTEMGQKSDVESGSNGLERIKCNKASKCKAYRSSQTT